MSAVIAEQSVSGAPVAALLPGAGAPAPDAMPMLPREYLSCHLGAEEYGIDILRVQEIRSYEAPTRIANAPPHIKGVVNLRGVIVPIVDLRLKLGCDSVAYDGFTVVIVLNLRGRVVGAVVDGVSDVVALSGEQVRPSPNLCGDFDADYIVGIGTVRSGDTERMLILTDIEALLGGDDLGLLAGR